MHFTKDNQTYVSFTLQQWAGGGSVTLQISMDGTPFDFGDAVGIQNLTFANPGTTTRITVIVDADIAGTWNFNVASSTYTLYVGSGFGELEIENVLGSAKFNVNNITYDQLITIDNLTLNFGLTATDLDGDSYTLSDPLTIAMVDGSLPISATAVAGVDGNDGVVLVGNGDNDTLVGGSGVDILIGGPGNDTLDGGIGNDTASYANASSGVAVNLDTGTATGDGTDTLTSIENVIGSVHNDTITGSDGANVLDGGAGNDILMGGDGDDILISDVATIGGILTGDTGLDSVDGGIGIDTLILTTGSNIDFAVLNSGNNPITNIEIIDLNTGDHQLQNISLQDVLDITGKNIGESATLTIMGDAVDSVSLEGTWNPPVPGIGVDIGFDIYSHTGDPTVTLRVENTITDSII